MDIARVRFSLRLSGQKEIEETSVRWVRRQTSDHTGLCQVRACVSRIRAIGSH